jgi:hypothetical protein
MQHTLKKQGKDMTGLIAGKGNDHRPKSKQQLKWAGNQEAVTFLGYRPIRS